MNKPYTLDFDGLDGLYDIDSSTFIQADTEKTEDPISLSKDKKRDDKKAPSKISSSFLLGLSLLALSGLMLYAGDFFVHKEDEAFHEDDPKIEPLIKLKDKDIKEAELLAAKQEKQKILDNIFDIQDQLVKGEKIDSSKFPVIDSSNNKIDRTILEDGSSETHIVKADILTPNAFKKHSETVKNKNQSNTKNAAASLAKDKEETFDTLVLNEAYLDETELESKPVELVKKGVEFNTIDSAVATRAKNKEQENKKPHLKPADLSADSMPGTLTKQDTLNNNTINSDDERNSYTLRFDFNKTAILGLSTPKIETLKSFLQGCPGDIQVIGHTCNLGSLSDNQAFGRIRAEEIKDLLVKIGFSADRIKALSAGQNEPVASNETIAGRTLNRRVVVDCFSQPENNKRK